MNHLLRTIWFVGLMRPLVFFLLGVNIRHRERLCQHQPAIIVANHNSHLDTIVLMTCMPLRLLPKVRPVAAMDYFLSSRLLSWFARRIIGILPIDRGTPKHRSDPLAECSEALARNEILILFPEGTRGEPERLAGFKTGIAHLAKRHPGVPVVPVYLHGLGKALPKGEGLLVPFFCDMVVGDPLYWSGGRHAFMSDIEERMSSLVADINYPAWE